MRRWRPAALALAALAAAAPGAGGVPVPGSPCPVFPDDNVWHADVSALAVHPSSDAWIASMGGPTRRLHPDFGPAGPGEQPYGIPYVVVPGDHPKVPVAFEYADESDPGPYPLAADTPVESGSDRHALMVDRDRCVLYELFAANHDPAGSTAGSGAVWDLRSNALRPAGWTSADAAGLPVLAGLLRLDEVAAGRVDHAIRVTAQRTDRSFVWPARHHAGAARDPSLPPMGARFRLKASFDVSRFRPDTQVVLRAMQRHGLILADNGSNWYFTGTSEQGWDTGLLDELKTVPAGEFEAVDASPLMVDPDSAQARGAPAPPVTAPPPTATPRATAAAPTPPTTARSRTRAAIRMTTTVPASTAPTTPPPTAEEVRAVDDGEADAPAPARPEPPSAGGARSRATEIALLVLGAVSAAVAAVGAALRLWHRQGRPDRHPNRPRRA
jgi:hypothetical protein